MSRCHRYDSLACQCRSPVARVTGASYIIFASAVCNDVCAKFPEMGGQLEGAILDALTSHLHNLTLTDLPKESAP